MGFALVVKIVIGAIFSIVAGIAIACELSEKLRVVVHKRGDAMVQKHRKATLIICSILALSYFVSDSIIEISRANESSPILQQKEEARILVAQIRSLATEMEQDKSGSEQVYMEFYDEFDRRFSDRVEAMRDKLDAQMKRTKRLDALISGSPLLNKSNVEAVRYLKNLADEIERLANDL